MNKKKNFAVLISGNGTNLQAVLDAIAKKELNIKIVVVVSNIKNAFGLKRAEKANIKSFFFEKKPEEKRSEYDTRLAKFLKPFNLDYVLLLGWMRILTENFLKHYKVINLHPALPKTFVGVNCIEKQFNAFQRGEISECGIMTHFVPDSRVDDGPVIFTKKVPCFKGESLSEFEKRIHNEEHKLVVKTVKSLL